MANIKSAKKRILTNESARMRNKSKKTNLRTSMKKLETVITEGDKDQALVVMSEVSKKLDSAITSGIVHKNYAARQKSRFQKQINAM